MGSLFGGSPDMPTPQTANQPIQADASIDNASQAERVRRLRALGKQQSIFAGESGGIPGGSIGVTKLGGY